MIFEKSQLFRKVSARLDNGKGFNFPAKVEQMAYISV